MAYAALAENSTRIDWANGNSGAWIIIIQTIGRFRGCWIIFISYFIFIFFFKFSNPAQLFGQLRGQQMARDSNKTEKLMGAKLWISNVLFVFRW